MRFVFTNSDYFAEVLEYAYQREPDYQTAQEIADMLTKLYLKGRNIKGEGMFKIGSNEFNELYMCVRHLVYVKKNKNASDSMKDLMLIRPLVGRLLFNIGRLIKDMILKAREQGIDSHTLITGSRDFKKLAHLLYKYWRKYVDIHLHRQQDENEDE